MHPRPQSHQGFRLPLAPFTVTESKVCLCGSFSVFLSVSVSQPPTQPCWKNSEYFSNVSIWQCALVGGWLGGGIRRWAKLLAPAVRRVRVTQLRPRVTPPPSSAPRKPILEISDLRKKIKHVCEKDRPCLILALGDGDGDARGNFCPFRITNLSLWLWVKLSVRRQEKESGVFPPPGRNDGVWSSHQWCVRSQPALRMNPKPPDVELVNSAWSVHEDHSTAFDGWMDGWIGVSSTFQDFP